MVMTAQQLLNKTDQISHQKIGNKPVVVLPLEMWEQIEDQLENTQMVTSLSYRRAVARSRTQAKRGKVYELNLKTGKF